MLHADNMDDLKLMTNGKNTVESAPARELLNRKETGPGPHPLRPLDHLAYAIMIDAGADVADSLEALAKLRRAFVDWNEIRVARTQEIAGVVKELPNAERVALRIREEYNGLFDKKGALNFEFLAAGKPAEMRRSLVQQLPHLGKGAVSLLLYEFCPGASLPLSDDGLKQARKDGLIGKNGDRNQLSRVLHESLSPGEICLILQYWELAGMGNPYGEAGRRETAAARKRTRKTSVRAKAKSK